MDLKIVRRYSAKCFTCKQSNTDSRLILATTVILIFDIICYSDSSRIR